MDFLRHVFALIYGLPGSVRWVPEGKKQEHEDKIANKSEQPVSSPQGERKQNHNQPYPPWPRAALLLLAFHHQFTSRMPLNPPRVSCGSPLIMLTLQFVTCW